MTTSIVPLSSWANDNNANNSMAAEEKIGSPSPQPLQPMTKRDVRRNRIMDRLESVISTFNANQQHHYRAQLQAIQTDMTLILRADPYGASVNPAASETEDPSTAGLLPDSGEEIRDMVASLGVILPPDDAAQKDYWATAGSTFREFTREVNDSIERRDAELTALRNRHEAAINELERLTRQKMHQAEEEHKYLTSTIRQRLVASITKKRQQLLRDKEQLDIADSNALLLHPSHYTINHPNSPGGAAANRKTRHLRHRAASPNTGEAGDNGKRKRKHAIAEDDGNESLAPQFKAVTVVDALGRSRSPFKGADERNVYIQYEAPAYSLERLFTEKELALATDIARNATYRYFYHAQQKAQEEQGSGANGGSDASVDGEHVDPTATDNAAAGNETVNGTPPPSQPAAVEMVRETSHQVLTRGGARANPLAALSDLANAAASASAVGGGGGMERNDPFAPHAPTHHPTVRSEKVGAPAPPPVTVHDADSDFHMMRRAASHRLDVDGEDEEVLEDASAVETAGTMRHQLLDRALNTITISQPYRLPLLDHGPAMVGRGVVRDPLKAFAPEPFEPATRLQQYLERNKVKKPLGGEPMSRTTSAGGISELGAILEPPATSAGVTGARRGRGRLV